MNNFRLPLPAFTIIALFGALTLVGLTFFPLLTLQLEPNNSGNSVTVSYSYSGASQVMVEQDVTSKIEGLISLVKGVKKINSVSESGVGYVQAQLQENIKSDQVRFEVSTLVRQLYAKFPPGVSYPRTYVNKYSDGGKSILTYSLNGSISSSALKAFAEKTLKPELSLLKGIYEVNIYGANNYAWEINYNPVKMARLEIDQFEVENSINNYLKTFELGKSYIANSSSPANPSFIYTSLKTNRPDSVTIGRIPIKKIQQKLIYLEDIAIIKFAEQRPDAYYRINGFNAVNIDIVATKNTNFLFLAKQVKNKIFGLQQKLPRSCTILLTYDATQLLKKELNKIVSRTAATLIILLLFVLAISRKVHYLLLILISIVSNLCIAFILYYFCKLEIHLYSLAGITVSIGMIIDNSIVVIDHIRNKSNLRILLAVTGTTFTTIGSVCIVFFLKEEQQVKLLDLTWAIIINMGVSLFVSLFLIPALMMKFPLKKNPVVFIIKRCRKLVKWNHYYSTIIKATHRYRVIAFGLLILFFGTPIFRLPVNVQGDGVFAAAYNQSFGSRFYNENLRFWANVVLGGSLRLFFSKSDYFANDNTINQSRLLVSISMPKGISVEQMNNLITDWEALLKNYKQIKMFQSKVYSGQNADINITFKKEFEKTFFPFTLKKILEKKAIHSGLAEFDIQGVGRSFNNEQGGENTNYAIILRGYNYPALKKYAEQIKQLLNNNPRVESIKVDGERTYIGGKNNFEYIFQVPSPEKLLLNQLSEQSLNNALTGFSGDARTVAFVPFEDSYVPVIMTPANKSVDKWQLMNDAATTTASSFIRLRNFAVINKETAENKIIKENHQYQLVVNYNFIGDWDLAKDVSEELIDNFRSTLPLGYTIEGLKFNFWDGAQEELTWAIIITIGVVFLICTVLLNSIRQAVAVITLIPISYIGIFLAAYLFNYRFDEGGYAAFIILCGLVVSAPLFILNDFNNLQRDYPHRSKHLLYIKAFNTKITPVILSRVSIVLAMLPFIVFAENEAFWHAIAISVTAGIIFSLVATVIFLPLLLKGISKVTSW